jgi:hypothetical protein
VFLRISVFSGSLRRVLKSPPVTTYLGTHYIQWFMYAFETQIDACIIEIY